MKQNFTHQLFILHVYNETNEEQKEVLRMEFCKNSNLYEEFIDAKRVKKMLNDKIKSPSATSLRIIMEHSRKTEQLQEI